MNSYEGIFIVKPDAQKEELNRWVSAIQGIVTKHGGQVSQVDLWGRRPLEHRIRRQLEGQFIYVCFRLEASRVAELQQSVKLQEEVLKSLITRVRVVVNPPLPHPSKEPSVSSTAITEKGGKDGGSQ